MDEAKARDEMRMRMRMEYENVSGEREMKSGSVASNGRGRKEERRQTALLGVRVRASITLCVYEREAAMLHTSASLVLCMLSEVIF